MRPVLVAHDKAHGYESEFDACIGGDNRPKILTGGLANRQVQRG